MIPVPRPEEPEHFEQDVRARGRSWLARGGRGRAPSHWRAVLPEVGDGWFELILPSLQLVATDRVPKRHRKLVESTLARLPIAHDERVIRQRRAWLVEYERGRISLEGLRVYAPLLAAALEKQASTRGKKATKKVGKKRAQTRR